jgi:predicted ATP-grasp superfamily ATP-dependent carboligase
MDGALLAAMAHQPHVHDVPACPTLFQAGDPVCSVTAEGVQLEAVQHLLDERVTNLAERLFAPGLHRPRTLTPEGFA